MFALVAVAALASASSGHAQIVHWDGGGADDDWDTAANWDPDQVPGNGSFVVFGNDSTDPEVLYAGPMQAQAITFSRAETYVVRDLGREVGETLQLGGGDITVSDGSHTMIVHIDLQDAADWEVASGSSLLVPGDVSGNAALNKVGGGTLILSGQNSYSGGTTLLEGTLLAQNGDATGPGDVSVFGGATLGGIGGISGNVSVADLGILAPGTSHGTLTLGSDLTLEGSYACEFGGATSDVLAVTGDLDVGLGTLDLAQTAPNGSAVHIIATYGTLTGTFLETNNLPAGATIDYAYNDGSSTANIAILVPIHTGPIYVHSSVVSNIENGLNWSNAYRSLQDALAAAVTGTEVWVAAGTYLPDEGTSQIDDLDHSSFHLPENVAVYGGFQSGDTLLSDQDPLANPTMLSGDLAGDDDGVSGIVGQNAHSVVTTLDGQSPGTLLDGFTIQGAGFESSFGIQRSSEFYFHASFERNDLTAVQLNFVRARTSSAVFEYFDKFIYATTLESVSYDPASDTSHLLVSVKKGNFVDWTEDELDLIAALPTSTSFVDIWADKLELFVHASQPGGYSDIASVKLASVSSARDGGGGLTCVHSSPTIRDCLVVGNHSAGNGAGIYARNSTSDFINCAVANNAAGNSGAGVFLEASDVRFTGVTISGNRAGVDGGAIRVESSDPSLTNTILWNNQANGMTGTPSASVSEDVLSSPTYAHSLVENLNPAGINNLDGTNPANDPHFAYPAEPAMAPLVSGVLVPGQGSAAIDAGDNGANPATVDLANRTRVTDGDGDSTATIDLGAYENQGILYVDASASPPNDGSSWADAYTNLQSALAAAVPGSEIWVAAGIYFPDEGTDTDASFQLKSGVALFGGFAGGETVRSARNPAVNPTILSGDLEENDGGGLPVGTNSRHVVTGSGSDSTAVLDGFFITGGDAVGSGNDGRGGGMLNNVGHPNVVRCVFHTNQSEGNGGGVHNVNSSPTFADCSFTNNVAGTNGGGMHNAAGASPRVIGCEFRGNDAGLAGGGIRNNNANAPVFFNCLVSGNQAGTLGGGILANGGSDTSLINATVSGNSASTAGGGLVANNAILNLYNGIVWNNRYAGSTVNPEASLFLGGSGVLNAANSLLANIDLTGSGTHNLDGTDPANDPLFVAPVSPASAPSIGGDFDLFAESAALEWGDNAYIKTSGDLNGNARIQGCSSDLGAYEHASNIPDEYCSWIAAEFPAETDPAILNILADPNDDGVNNGLAFIAGATANDPAEDVLGIVDSTGGTLEIEFFRADGGNSLQSEIEATLDFVTWGPIDTISPHITASALPATGGITLTFQVDQSQVPHLFWRRSFIPFPGP